MSPAELPDFKEREAHMEQKKIGVRLIFNEDFYRVISAEKMDTDQPGITRLLNGDRIVAVITHTPGLIVAEEDSTA